MKQFVLALFCCVPLQVNADQIDDITTHFFELMQQGKSTQALDTLLQDNRWLSKDSDGMVQLRGNLARSGELFGQYRFHELISESRIGTHYVYRIYMVGYERQPLTCKITFYKPEKHWRVQNIVFGLGLVDEVSKQADARLVK